MAVSSVKEIGVITINFEKRNWILQVIIETGEFGWGTEALGNWFWNFVLVVGILNICDFKCKIL
jgi:hypothetical protein